jgi:hypothetical protein
MRAIQFNNSWYNNESSNAATFESQSPMSMTVQHSTELALW